MTTPPTDPNVPPGVAPVKAAKPGVPRAALLGGAVVALAGVAGAAFYFLSPKPEETADTTTPPPASPAQVTTPTTTGVRPSPKPSVDPKVAAAKAQAQAALSSIDTRTSFDNVPPDLGGTAASPGPGGMPTTGTAPAPGASPGAGGAAKKVFGITQGKLPSANRTDPFVSRLIVPIQREYAYTLAVPVRLAPPARPVLPKASTIPPELRYGPLVFTGRVAGFLEFGGVSAILETGVGTGAFEIVQPGSSVSSGIPGVPPLTVESISNTELVLRSEDGRTARVPLSGVPGGPPGLPTGGPGGGAPSGYPGAPGGGFPGAPGGGGRGQEGV